MPRGIEPNAACRVAHYDGQRCRNDRAEDPTACLRSLVKLERYLLRTSASPLSSPLAAMADPSEENALHIAVLDPCRDEHMLSFKVFSHIPMVRILGVLRQKGWGDVSLLYEGKLVEDTDTPATLNLHDGSLIQAVLPIDLSPPEVCTDGQTTPRLLPVLPEYVTVRFNRWDDDSACVELRMHPEQILGYVIKGLSQRWQHELPPYTAICYSYNGYYLGAFDTATSLALPSVAQINTHLFGYYHYRDRDDFGKDVEDGTYLEANWNGRQMVTISVERWDSKGFLRFRMDTREPFIPVGRAIHSIWASETPPGYGIALRGPDGVTIAGYDSPASLGLEDGVVISTWLQKKVRRNKRVSRIALFSIHSKLNHAEVVQIVSSVGS